MNWFFFLPLPNIVQFILRFISKNFRQLFGTVFETIYWFKNILNRIFGERRKLSKVLECTLPFHTLKASILNPGIILSVLFDMVTTPPRRGVYVILCDDMFLLMSAYWLFHAIGVWYVWDSSHLLMLFVHTGWKPGKSRSWVDPSLSLVPRRDECAR